MRSNVHYLAALAVLGIYGSQVCPFLETLSPLQLAGPIAVALVGQMLLRIPLGKAWVATAPDELRASRALTLELFLFFAAGIAVSAFNRYVYDFPWESGIKVVSGFFTIGFFVAVDVALAEEHALAKRYRETGASLSAAERRFPVSRKIAIFAAVSALLSTFVFFLVVNKDLDWLSRVGEDVSFHDAQRSILGEFAFIATVILAYTLTVIASYARNLRYFFDTETEVLRRTNEGDLSGAVPVSTQDEFGVMAHHTNLMVEAIRARTEEVQRTQDVTILSMATLAETRDNETGAHILRTQRYVRALAERMAQDPKFAPDLDTRAIDLLYKSAPLHDIGKVGIPDAILLKPGKLDDDEFDIMKTHAALGGEAIRVAEKEMGEGTSFLAYAREIAETHHEKWDGSGYPNRLAGEAIPLSGRLMAVADVYDALISKRVYKPAFPHEKARDIIVEGRGTHFDPAVVDAFLAVEDRFKDIAADFNDEAYGGEG